MSRKLSNKPKSKILNSMDGRQVSRIGQLDVSQVNGLRFDELLLLGMDFRGMDSALIGPAGTQGNIPVDFLRTHLAGPIRALTTVRGIDRLFGIDTVGAWEDEELVIQSLEPVGMAHLYSDNSDIPLASYGYSEEVRAVVRGELGFQVGKLESARNSRANIDAAVEKRWAADEGLEMFRNMVGFYGFLDSNGKGRTFGALNDPNLPAYETVAVAWLAATFAQITGDINSMFSLIEQRSGGHIRDDTAMTLALPLGYRSALSVANDSGKGETVKEWLSVNYPNVRVEYIPEFVGANGGANVVYMFAENIQDGSGASSKSAIQAVPTKHTVIGSEQNAKTYVEDFGNATAGVVITRPYAFARMTGV